MAKQKAQIPTIRSNLLAPDLRTAIADVKTRLKSSLPGEQFRNEEHRLPRPDRGCEFRKIRVGAARPGDPRPAGKRRLIVEVNLKSRQIMEVYFSDSHYMAGSFRRLIR
jgi:hypothetical protein